MNMLDVRSYLFSGGLSWVQLTTEGEGDSAMLNCAIILPSSKLS